MVLLYVTQCSSLDLSTVSSDGFPACLPASHAMAWLDWFSVYRPANQGLAWLEWSSVPANHALAWSKWSSVPANNAMVWSDWSSVPANHALAWSDWSSVPANHAMAWSDWSLVCLPVSHALVWSDPQYQPTMHWRDRIGPQYQRDQIDPQYVYQPTMHWCDRNGPQYQATMQWRDRIWSLECLQANNALASSDWSSAGLPADVAPGDWWDGCSVSANQPCTRGGGGGAGGWPLWGLALWSFYENGGIKSEKLPNFLKKKGSKFYNFAKTGG